MDIAAMSTALSQSNIMAQASVSVAKIGMDMVKQQGQAMTKLMESTALETTINSHIGSNIDIKL
ncbi:MAG: YjfB family protein [Vallitalea sp.]|jgi:hypothetical protein|nr:YjfB family protein [Vallitalea sp.]